MKRYYRVIRLLVFEVGKVAMPAGSLVVGDTRNVGHDTSLVGTGSVTIARIGSDCKHLDGGMFVWYDLCMLPHNQKLPTRSRRPTILVAHTTGRNLSSIAARNNSQDLANGAHQWYVSSGSEYYGHELLAPDCTRAQLCPDERVAWHTGMLPAKYGADNWRDFAYHRTQKRIIPHNRDPHAVYDWWDARWGRDASPLDLTPNRTRSVNAVSWALDLLPTESGQYVPEQITLAAHVLAEKCLAFGLTADAIFGHADLDPLNRGIVWKNRVAIGRDWDPAIEDFMGLRRRVAELLEAQECRP